MRRTRSSTGTITTEEKIGKYFEQIDNRIKQVAKHRHSQAVLLGELVKIGSSYICDGSLRRLKLDTEFEPLCRIDSDILSELTGLDSSHIYSIISEDSFRHAAKALQIHESFICTRRKDRPFKEIVISYPSEWNWVQRPLLAQFSDAVSRIDIQRNSVTKSIAMEESFVEEPSNTSKKHEDMRPNVIAIFHCRAGCDCRCFVQVEYSIRHQQQQGYRPIAG